jgi:transcriptional regulator with XRE-family HTH domain
MKERIVVLGQNIRRLREARGWNQVELGHHADLSVSLISRIERGLRSPSVATLAKISDALEVDIVDLFEPGEEPHGEAVDKLSE